MEKTLLIISSILICCNQNISFKMDSSIDPKNLNDEKELFVKNKIDILSGKLESHIDKRNNKKALFAFFSNAKPYYSFNNSYRKCFYIAKYLRKLDDYYLKLLKEIHDLCKYCKCKCCSKNILKSRKYFINSLDKKNKLAPYLLGPGDLYSGLISDLPLSKLKYNKTFS